MFTSTAMIKMVTRLSDRLPAPWIAKAARSWNGKFLTFQFQNDYQDETSTKYLVLNVESSELEGFCIASLPMGGGEDQAPVWSPDDRYRVISNTKTNSYGDLILVDVLTQTAYHLTTDVHVVGWMEKL